MDRFQVPPLQKFDFSKPEEWPKWSKIFERFRVASGLELQPEENQVNTLIYTMGDEAEDILTSLLLTSEQLSEYNTFFFVINIFLFIFTHNITTQYPFKTKKYKKTTDVYSLFQKSNQKGERE